MFARQYVTLLSLLAAAVLALAACAPDTTTASEADRSTDDHAEEATSAHNDTEATESHADEGDSGHGHSGAAEALDSAKEIRVVANEFAFEPASLHLHEGEAVNIVFINEGAVEHEMELEAFDFHAHAEPGETVTVGFVPDKSGSFEFGCFVPGHYDAGMSGQLVVEPAHS